MQWKIAEDFPLFEVSEYGNVREVKTGRIIEPYYCSGRPQVYLKAATGKAKAVFSHRLVAFAFIGPKPFDGAEVCHNDGSKLNNHYSNLRWDSRRNNNIDKIRHGTSNPGEANPSAKLTASKVMEIRRMVAEGETVARIGAQFGIAGSTVSRIANRQKWRHIA